MNAQMKKVSKAILETPNASDYEFLVARNALEALLDLPAKMFDNEYARKSFKKTIRKILK